MLHHVLEQGDYWERSECYCASCARIPLTEISPRSTDEAVQPFRRCCRGCGRELEGGAGRRLLQAPVTRPGFSPTETATIRTVRPEFYLASSLPHFSLGFPQLDSMMRPLSSRRLIVMKGDAAPAVAELMTFRAQLPLDMGGLDSTVFFIDGGNRSDLYLFSLFAKWRGLKPAVAMRRVATCRIFTNYQLADFVSRRLADAVEDHAAKLVVISDPLGTFSEPEQEERETRWLLKSIKDGIGRLKHSLVVVALASPNGHDDAVMEWADVGISLTSSRDRVQAGLVKHPTKPPTTSNFTLNQLLKSAKRGAPC